MRIPRRFLLIMILMGNVICGMEWKENDEEMKEKGLSVEQPEEYSSHLLSTIAMKNLYYVKYKNEYYSQIKHLIPLANLDSSDALGNTALLKAVSAGDVEIVRDLLNGGANPDLDNKKTGASPLISLVWRLHDWKDHRYSHPHLYGVNFKKRMWKILKLLKKHGVDTAAKCNDKTAKNWACVYNVDEIFSELCEDSPIEECSVCLTNVAMSDSSYCELPCSHVFHNSCIISWRKIQKNCPMCRG